MGREKDGRHGALGARVFGASMLRGEFRLRSGQTSDEYFDKYLFEGDPELLRAGMGPRE